MPSDVQIKQFELSDEDALLSFLRIAYPGEPLKGDPTFWKWHFLNNPYAGHDDIPLWIVKSGADVVGQMATIPVRLKVGDQEKRALWIIDFILLPEYRGQKLGKRLVQMAQDTYCTSMMALGYNDQSGVVFHSLGWDEQGNINRYHKLLFPGDAAKEISRIDVVRRIANLIYAPFRPRLTKLTLSGEAELREVTKFDASFDELWEDASKQWPCAVVRSSRLLEWQFMNQPGKKFDVLGYYEKDRLLGYVVLFFRKAESGGVPHKVAISDLCYSAVDPLHVIDCLLKGALKLALERRVGGLVIDVLDEQVESRLKQFGFWRISASPSFIVGTIESQDLMYKRSNWFLTRGDSDVSIFEEPNV